LKETVHFLAQHGYWLLFAAVLGRQACLPVPANLIVVAAGALARSGKLSLPAIVGLAVTTFVFADLAWYEVGRRWGDRTLHFFSGLSRDPEALVGRATKAFARHGARMLLISKFVLGLDAVAAPLTGAEGIPVSKFVWFDGLGALLWSSCYATAGYVFSDQLDRVALHVERMGALLALAVGAVCGFYIVKKVDRWLRFMRAFRLARITPEELRDQLIAGADILIIDLQRRAGGAGPMGIPGAVRIDPWNPAQYKNLQIPPLKEVVLYCASPGEFTSAHVALALRERGAVDVRPLAGGFHRWQGLGFPVTAKVGNLTNVAARS